MTVLHSKIDNSDYYGRTLLNRTAGECFCTLPVLRRLSACRYCIQSSEVLDVFDDYSFDCAALGYWTDRNIVDVEEQPSSTGGVTATSTTSTASATSTSGGGGGNAAQFGGADKVAPGMGLSSVSAITLLWGLL